MKKQTAPLTEEEYARRKKSRFRLLWLLIIVDCLLVLYLVIELVIVFLH